ISISDTGPGLSDEVRQRIFAPFFTTKNGKGTGLGLSISFNIIQRLGGDIKADNNEQGGSVFQVFLPESYGSKETRP
ncbi:MAG: HAMP domain-containing sensor histidine kinase, partial [Thermoleophilia bacterium]|nr:HAMP domain-containing sensor histidine kinase [Thermoleophilia bacterium]